MSDDDLIRRGDALALRDKIADTIGARPMSSIHSALSEYRNEICAIPATDAREAARVLLAHPAALSAIVDAMLRGANVAEPTQEDAATVSQCLREALMLIGDARDD